MGGCYKRLAGNPETDYCLYNDRQDAEKNLVMSIIKDRARRDALNNSKI